MPVTGLRVVLTAEDFDQALHFYRDALGLEQTADWSSEDGRVVLLEAGRATLELFDEAQAEHVDRIEAGRRVAARSDSRSRWPTARRRPSASWRPVPSKSRRR